MAASGMPDTAHGRMPLLTALGAQAAAALLVFGGTYGLSGFMDFRPPLIGLLALQGILAAGLGHFFGLAPWWAPVQLALLPAVALALTLRIPAWIFLAVFLGLLGVFWNSARGGVPLYLSNRKTKDVLAGLLPAEGGFRFADLGCGLGGPVLALSRARPEGHFTGIETAPLLFAFAWLRRRVTGAPNADIQFADFRTLDLGSFDFVYCFLSPVPMPGLYDKALREMRPGSLLISNSFDVPGHPADETVAVGDGRETRLHLWRM